jgi:hypothetical protein
MRLDLGNPVTKGPHHKSARFNQYEFSEGQMIICEAQQTIMDNHLCIVYYVVQDVHIGMNSARYGFFVEYKWFGSGIGSTGSG